MVLVSVISSEPQKQPCDVKASQLQAFGMPGAKDVNWSLLAQEQCLCHSGSQNAG